MTDASPTPPHEPFRTRIDVLFARDAPKAVILRRGPKRHYHLIAWDLNSDTLTHGQWMKATDLRLCDLSPDGGRLIYWASQYHNSAPRHIHAARQRSSKPADAGGSVREPLRAAPTRLRTRRKQPRDMETGLGAERPSVVLKPRRNEGVWTAISTPPFFSALAIWPCFGHWTGGGVFLDDERMVLRELADGLVPQANVPIPPRFRVLSLNSVEQMGRALRTSAYDPALQPDKQHKDLAENLLRAGARRVEWVSPRGDGSLLFACDGCIHRLPKWETVDADDLIARATLITDLRPLTFRMIPPPRAAMRW